ncbi:flagellar hook-length control protein FliK [Pseudodesulfovibrio indicus]|uniref:Flagellar hook-length control protein FliK n=1 Tax=Pseudodesulfovibrio indicus TaxID=1716143 RepID=A0A140D8U4_9BACT|nr:flagellar hook-length control protein FliK [Pseudodesulfovibrio indicus]AMK09611.1 hypothetical protein AWY79_00060 [Pseudodesulfovibrio indicus]TDT86442.1 flagellar hook-length control protein FliK [Pseudodesulfovibrio indicus]
MQNIPGTATEVVSEAAKLVKLATTGKSGTKTAYDGSKDDRRALFAELFNEHTEMVEDELAMAPVSSREKMLDSAPKVKDEEEKTPSSVAGTKARTGTEEKTQDKSLESRMTQEDLDAVKEDLQAYGMSDEEIAAIEKEVNSEEGLTWGKFVATVAKKMADLRKAEMSDEQKASLAGFFNKIGFSEKESAKLISQLEKGNVDQVLKQVEAKIDSLSGDKQLLFTKDEVEAFVSAMGLSKEFVNQVQELFATNSLPKDVKAAFTKISQEMAGLDKKDQKLVRALGKAFAASMGDANKESTAAAQLEAAVDLKPRVADHKNDSEAREEMADAFNSRRESSGDDAARRNVQQADAGKAAIKADANTRDDAGAQGKDEDYEAEHDRKWNNAYAQGGEDAARAEEKASGNLRAASADTSAKTVAAQQTAATAAAKAAEKVSPPKVMRQVDQAILKTLSNGAKQLTIQLTPENLGKLSVVLSVQGKEVSATIRTEHADTTKVIADNLDIIKNSLESQGLKVDKLEVQTGLADNSNHNGWFGESEHNLYREREAMVAMRNHMRSMREQNGTGLARDMQSVGERAISSDHGLHIIA